MNNKERDCPLKTTDWINFLQNHKSHIIAKTILYAGGLISLFVLLVSLMYFVESSDNVITNFFRGVYTINKVYIIFIVAFTVSAVIIFFVIPGILINFKKSIKSIDELIRKIIDGENDPNKIRNEWRKLLENKGFRGKNLVKKSERKKVESWGTGRRDYSAPKPPLSIIAVIAVLLSAISIFLMLINMSFTGYIPYFFIIMVGVGITLLVAVFIKVIFIRYINNKRKKNKSKP